MQSSHRIPLYLSWSADVFLLPGILLQIEVLAQRWQFSETLQYFIKELIFPHGKKLSVGKLEGAAPKIVVFKEYFKNLQEMLSRERGEFNR